MDDFNLSCLTEAKNEYAARLVNILTPCVHDGIQSIFQEAWNLCDENDEQTKYLVTFQNFLARIPKWNQSIIEEETTRILETSGCAYLEDLVTCVHIIQLKVLTSIRVGMKQKKLELDVPQLGDFIHRVYIAVARKLYKNVYLLERGIPALQVQRYQRELELLIREAILNTIRDSIPTDHILRAYMDPSTEIEEEVEEREYVEEVGAEKEMTGGHTEKEETDEKKETEEKQDVSGESNTETNGIVVKKEETTTEKENSTQPLSVDISNTSIPESNEKEKKEEKPEITVDTTVEVDSSENRAPTQDISFTFPIVPSIASAKKSSDETKTQTLQFNDIDQVLDMGTNKRETVEAPKTVERLERIGEEKDQQRRMEEEEEEEPLQILDDVNEVLDIEPLDKETPDKSENVDLDVEEFPF